jgi:hypothetical protein
MLGDMNLPDRGAKVAEVRKVEEAGTDRIQAQVFHGIRAHNLARLKGFYRSQSAPGASCGDRRNSCCREPMPVIAATKNAAKFLP